ncbi:MAG: hypothetical protein E6Q36_05290 [Chryseobacterium sp.]|nr:MAG: hypothetical protein E6Q36_05290 [Chryseobacterium sp.]
MNLVNKSQREWLEQGGSEDALKFIDEVVGKLHTKAVAEGVLYKQAATEVVEETVVAEVVEEEVANEVVVTDEAFTDKTEVVVTETPVVVAEVETKNASQPDSQVLVNMLVETIFAAQKQYHTDVVEPLIAELNTLKAATVKAAQSSSVFSWDMTALLPAAAVASKIKKEFGSGNEAITGVVVEEESIAVKEVAPTQNSGNLLSGF